MNLIAKLQNSIQNFRPEAPLSGLPKFIYYSFTERCQIGTHMSSG